MEICVEILVFFHKFILGIFKTIAYDNRKSKAEIFSAGVLDVLFCLYSQVFFFCLFGFVIFVWG